MSVLARARLSSLGLVGAALLSVGVVVWTGRVPTSLEQEVRQRHLLSVFRREDVDRIELRHGDQLTVVARRPKPMLVQPIGAGEAGASGSDDSDLPESEWSLVEPFETDADPVPIDQLLGSLQYATWERESDAPAAEAPSVPQSELVVVLGQRSYRLRLGGDALSPPGARYVEVSSEGSGSHTFVIKKRLVDDLFVEGDAFRGRQIAPYSKHSISRIVLSSAAGVRRLRRVNGDFHFDGMEDNQRAERHALDRIFLALARARAEPFVDVEAAKAAASLDASVRVSLVPLAEDKPEASLELGGKCPSSPELTLAIRHLPDPIAGCVDRSVLYALREPAAALIDHHLFGFDADEVDTVRIVEGDSVLEFARGGDGFVLRQPRSTPLDADAAADRLGRILDIQGDLLTGSAVPTNASSYSAATLTLESSARPGEERTVESVRLSEPLGDGGRRIYREADGAVLVVSRESALSLHADATLMKDHAVFNYPLQAISRVAIENGAQKQILERSSLGMLSLSEPKGYSVDGGLATALLDELRTLRALRWVTDRESPGFGLDKPRARVRLTLQVDGHDVERTLLVGARAPGGFYASVDRDPGVFVASRELDRVLSTWLLDRAAFSAEPDTIVELSLEAPGLGSVVLRRVGGQLTLQKGSSGFDGSRIDELLEAINSLRCEAAVHLGPATPVEGLRKPLLIATIRRQSIENVGSPPIRFSIGSRDSFRDASIHYARVGSINATFALPREQVQQLLDFF